MADISPLPGRARQNSAAGPPLSTAPSAPAVLRHQRIRPQPPSAVVVATLLALGGVRDGAVVLDLTPGASLVRPAAAAAGRTGVVVAAPAAALVEGLPSALRSATVTNVFAGLPGSRVLTALRPLLRAGARVAITAVTADAVREACMVAAYDILHVEDDVDGVVVAALRPRQPT